MTSCLGPSGIISLAAIITIIMGLAQGICALLGILLYNCTIAQKNPINLTETGPLLYLVYFWNPLCHENLTISVNDVNNIQATLQIQTATNIHPATKTNIWMIVYASVNVVLIIASLLMIVAVRCAPSWKQRFGIYCPWIVFSGLMLLMDVVATILYGLDINKITDIKDLTNFIQMKEITDLPSAKIDLKIPSIIMTISFLRLGLFWIINLVLVILVIKSALKLSDNSSKAKSAQRQPHANYDKDNRFANNRYDNVREPPVAPTDNHNYNTNPIFDNNERPLTKENLDQWNQSMKQPPQSHWLKNKEDTTTGSLYNGSDRGGERFNNKKSNLKATPYKYETQENQNIKPPPRSPGSDEYEYIQHPPRNSQDELQDVSNKIINALKRNISDAQSRGSVASDRTNDVKPSVNKPSVGLRSQMPWSYFQSTDNQPITAPRRNFSELNEDEDLPSVPVPDYTLHFPKRPRGDDVSKSQLSKSRRSDSPPSSGSWQGQEVLY